MPAGREVCFQQACLTCRIAKVSAKDGKRNSQTTRCAVRDPGRLDFTSHQRELLVLFKEIRAFKSIPAWLALRVALLRVLDDGSHSDLLL
jgi:hypothetical protein